MKTTKKSPMIFPIFTPTPDTILGAILATPGTPDTLTPDYPLLDPILGTVDPMVDPDNMLDPSMDGVDHDGPILDHIMEQQYMAFCLENDLDYMGD